MNETVSGLSIVGGTEPPFMEMRIGGQMLRSPIILESFGWVQYREAHEANAMRRTLVLMTLLSAAFTGHAASIFTPSIQNVRFAQESSPANVVVPPTVLTHPAALYTDEAQRRGIQGTVIVQAYFDAYGNISVLRVVKGLGYGLDEAAVAALQGWRFAPALRDGLPVSAVAEIEVPFQLPVKWLAGDGVLVNGRWVTSGELRTVMDAINGKAIVINKTTDPQGRTINSIWVAR
jgi:TonB family protein